MCGIAGLASTGGPPPEARAVERMCDALAHRGPDDAGVDVRCGVGLGIRRLSIIDVEGGRQPYASEDGSIRAVFNGEIYNFRELRRELEAKGHRFATRADGEVIVHLWEELGTAFPAKLDGMFAIALHDSRARRLVLVRDRLGIKPLFVHRSPTAVAFASEPKAILAAGAATARLDPAALGELLAWEYVPAPRTLFEGIRKLEPGCLLEADLATGAERMERWWEIPPPSGPGSERTDGEWSEAVEAAVRSAVQRQLVSDVPLGAFLSGGVDSSLVVAAMGPARAFSIGFDDPTYDELPWARRVAARLGVEHTAEVMRPRALELFETLMDHLDDPIGDFSIFPTYLVSRLARAHVKVVLTGDGGDELFGGYETYAAQEIERSWRRIPRPLRRGVLERGLRALRPRAAKKGVVNRARRFVEGLAHPAALEHARWRLFVGDELRRELVTDEARRLMEPVGAHIESLFRAADGRSPLDRRLYVDVRSYLVDNCLVKVDRMSMACSLEARVPLLDHSLVELAFRVPERLKARGRRTKVLLKRIAARRLPRECVYRPKEGFSVPIKAWLAGPLRPALEERLDAAALEAEGIFRPAAVERLVREHLAGRENHSHVLWTLLVFQEWRRRWNA